MQRRHLLAFGVLVAAIGFLLLPTAGQAGGTPSIAWSPTTSTGTYDYGTLDAGAGATKSVTFTLSNSGGSATGMLSITLTNTSGTAFTLTSDKCSTKSIGTKKTCTATVKYAPSGNGENDSATLTANSAKPAATASITLIGASGEPDLTLSPGQFVSTASNGDKLYDYDFGVAQSGTQTFTVTNSGTGSYGPLVVIGGDETGFSLSNDTCVNSATHTGVTLAPNDTCTFDLTFTSPGCTDPEPFPTSVDVFQTPDIGKGIHLEVLANCVPT